MQKLHLVFGVMAAASLTGCSTFATESAKMPTANYSFNQEQSCPAVLEMQVNETLHLSVDENITTGYLWQLKASDIFKVEELYESQFKKPTKTDMMMVGRGDPKIFRVTALKAGDASLEAYHGRGWEPQTPAQWSCNISVK